MDFPERLSALRKELGFTQAQMAARLGVKANWISKLESGTRLPSDTVVNLLGMLEDAHKKGLYVPSDLGTKGKRPPRESDDPTGARETEDPLPLRSRMTEVPIVSWAHAGEAHTYEELPKTWREWIPTYSRDPKAFAVRLVGDSMSREYLEGDLIIVEPGREPYSGCLAVVRLADGGILFRKVEMRGQSFELVPFNMQYQAREFRRSEISWIYPMHAMIRMAR